jgi:PKD repeat protein
VSGQNTTINGTGLEATANTTNSITVNGTVITTPGASFSSDVILGYAPLAVRFTDTSLNLPTSWTWDFGDGGTSSLQDPVHTFNSGGQFSVVLMATNLAGTGNFTSNISVFAPGFSAVPNSGKAPFTVTFTDTGTGYPPPTAWYWDFGDNSTRSLRNTTHQYTQPGTYDVKFRMTGAAGTAWVNRSAAVTVT